METKVQKLKKKLSDLESRLFEARVEENERFARIGWGTGMRCVKCTISTRKSDNLRARIEDCKKQIEEEMQKVNEAKRNFRARYICLKNEIIDALDKGLERAVGNNALNFEDVKNNYLDVYPLVSAVLQREADAYLRGGADEGIRRQQKRQATAYRNDYRIWHDYAGDYKSEQRNKARENF